MLTPESIALVVEVFLLAGWVKGAVGMGLPTGAMGALGLVMAPVQAAALLVVPSLVSKYRFGTATADFYVCGRCGVVPFVTIWALLTTTTGEGPSVGGRGMVLLLVLFPIGIVVGALLNCWVLVAPLTRRLNAFLLGTVVPALLLVLGYAYLWRVGPFAH